MTSTTVRIPIRMSIRGAEYGGQPLFGKLLLAPRRPRCSWGRPACPAPPVATRRYFAAALAPFGAGLFG